jgi:hypothetical protein
LLIACREFANESPASHDKIGAGLVEVSGHNEELLFPTQVAEHILGVSCNADILEQPQPLGPNCID